MQASDSTHWAGAVPRVEQGIDAALVVVLVVAGVAALRGAAAHGGARKHARVVVATIVTALLALAARLALFPPSFVHANFHGPSLVDDILAAPAHPATGRDSYGQATYAILGFVAHAVSPRFETIAWTNAVVGVASLVAAGALAARWTGRCACAPLAVAAGALQPALARVACSEDAHQLAGLFGLIALLGMDVHATRPNRAALVVSVAAAALMVDSRQTFYVWAPCVVAVAIARGGWAALRRTDTAVATIAIAAALVARIAATAAREPAQVAMLPAALASPRLLWALVRHHPLLDMGRFAMALLPLEVAGVVAMRGSPMRRAYLLLLGASLLVTLPFGFPVSGVECSFRMPALLLALVAAASGAEWLWRAGSIGRSALAIAIASPVVLPSWREMRDPTPATREYVFVRDVASRALPERFALAEIRPVDPMPAYRLARAALPAAVERVDAEHLPGVAVRDAPVVFLAGLQCRARSGLEVSGVGRKVETLSMEELRDMAVPPFEHRAPPAPATIREECERVLRDADPVGPELVIVSPADENPFVFYGGDAVRVRFWKLRAAP